MINGATLRKRRDRLKLTQKQLASALGLTQPAVSRWEHGKRIANPHILDLAISFLEIVADDKEKK